MPSSKYRVSLSFFERHPRLIRQATLAATFAAFFALGIGVGSWTLVCRGGQCPSPDELSHYKPRQTSKLYSADGQFIAELGLERRTLLPLDSIPPMLRDAFLIVEDRRFYSHHGIDWWTIPGAMVANIRAAGFVQGFSTITMQLAGNIFPERINRRERSGLGAIARKLKEIKVARRIDAAISKDRILELYLNQIDLGNGAHGVETASQRYFGKSARNLNLPEVATLAALPKAPGRYNPRRFPDRAIQRRNTVIEVMRREGLISDADASVAKAYPLRLANRADAGDVAPYYVEWIRQLLDQQFGAQLYEQGLKVYTTLDLELQGAAERSLERQLKAIESGKYGPYQHQTYEEYLAHVSSAEEGDSRRSPYLQGAMVVLDPRTGAVRAMVGGRDFDDSKFNRAVQALRQPGSTFKPFVYATAIQRRRPPTYILDDSPLEIPQVQGDTWAPQNYDLNFEGQIPMRRALYESRNVPAIRLGMELGEQNVVETARRFGITTHIPLLPSIHLGAAAVYPIEMVSAFSTFATLGMHARAMGITKVENAKGEVLWTPEPIRTPALAPEEAWIMVDMLKDVVKKGSAAGAVGAQFKLPTAGKTGTTNDGTDVWYIGFTSDLVAGVWIGLDDNTKIKANAQGGVLAAPAWTAFMIEAYRRKPAPPDWPRPTGIVTKTIDLLSNTLWSRDCPGIEATEFFLSGTEPSISCSLMPGMSVDSVVTPVVPDTSRRRPPP